MPEGTTSLGLTGLTHQTNKRQAAKDDLKTLSQLYSLKKSEENEEMQAAAMEQKYYDDIKAEADKLLAPDRIALNNKAKSIQSEIRKNIKLFGGSKKKFMANGGLAMIGSYKSQVLDSEENQIAKENKVNMERILDIKQKNLGHLLTPQDQMALENYERNGGGRITYSGLMSEIEIPNSNLFDYGTNISPIDIIGTGANKMKLISNYMLEYPDAVPPNPETQEGHQRLISYVLAKGYGGKGSNTTKLQMERANRSRKTSTGAIKDDKTKSSISGALKHIVSNQKQVDINNIKDDSFRSEGYIDATIGDNFVTKWDIRAEQNPTILNAIGNIIPGFEGDNGYRLRGARKLNDQLTNKLWTSKFGTNYEIEGNTLKGFNIEEGMEIYKANGELVDENIDAHNYKIIGSALSWQTVIDGKERLIVDAVNEENEFDKDRTESLYKTEKGSNNATGSPVMVIMLKDEDSTYDDDYYVRIPYGDDISQTFLSQQLGEADDITEFIKEDVKKSGIQNDAEIQRFVEKEAKINPSIKLDHEALQSDVFEMQNTAYNTDPKSDMRNNFRRAFYLAQQDIANNGSMKGIEQQIENNAFHILMENYGLITDIKNPQISDSELLNKILLASGTDNQDNLLFVEKMRNYLTALYGTKK